MILLIDFEGLARKKLISWNTL